MTAFAPIDIEDELRAALDSEGCHVFAPPVPDDLSARIPCARVRRTGGIKRGLVVDQSQVVIDVWADTDAAAMFWANYLSGVVTALKYAGSGHIRDADIVAEPYQNNDPSHPDLCRCAFMCSVYSVSERS